MRFKIHLKRVVAFLDCIPSFLLRSCVSLSSPLLVTDAVPTVAERGIELKVSLIVAERELELEVCWIVTERRIELKVSLTVARRGIEFKDNLFVAERGIELKVSLFVAESGIEIEVSLIVSTYPRHQLHRLATGAAVVVDHYSLDCLENDVEDSQLPFFNQSTLSDTHRQANVFSLPPLFLCVNNRLFVYSASVSALIPHSHKHRSNRLPSHVAPLLL